MANTALRAARIRAHLSQDDLARRIREAGSRTGDRNGCTRGMVQRWESGRTLRPQGRYLLALENVLGQPAYSLGFADEIHGVDRARALDDAGLSAAYPVPDPAADYGPLTGIWLSAYEYHSSSRGEDLTSRHYVTVTQQGLMLRVHSLPKAGSRLSMELSVNGSVVTGTWAERTDQAGYYQGAVYHGAIQMLLEPTGHRMQGKWLGFGRDLEVNIGGWTLSLVDADFSERAMSRWDREPGTGG
jgi:transcriptional regulator with XRE-family HTH domain